MKRPEINLYPENPGQLTIPKEYLGRLPQLYRTLNSMIGWAQSKDLFTAGDFLTRMNLTGSELTISASETDGSLAYEAQERRAMLTVTYDPFYSEIVQARFTAQANNYMQQFEAALDFQGLLRERMNMEPVYLTVAYMRADREQFMSYLRRVHADDSALSVGRYASARTLEQMHHVTALATWPDDVPPEFRGPLRRIDKGNIVALMRALLYSYSLVNAQPGDGFERHVANLMAGV